jgi:hypothetical protein
MIKKLWPYRVFVVLAVVTLLLQVLATRPRLVEKNYTYGLYPLISKTVRLLFGWLPFSIGDLLYAAAILKLLIVIWKAIKTGRQTFSKAYAGVAVYKVACALLWVYVVFNVLWGLNYSRQGIARQIGILEQPYTPEDVVQLTQALQQRLNALAETTDTSGRYEMDQNAKLFQKALLVYRDAEKSYPFLKYSYPSFKPSLYSGIGHFIGFTGYYNPFSGEAQIKTSIPIFLKPFVAVHEIAHQLGYAKENEANFVAFLASRQSGDMHFLYSTYYNLYQYAYREVAYRDSMAGKAFKEKLHPQVVRDNETLKAYFISTRNRLEPLFARFYNQYLKWNRQESGLESYNEVVALLIAYGKKWGWQAI